MKGLDKALEIPISKCPLKVEQIEQVTAVVTFDRKVQQGKEVDRFMIHCPTIRTVEPFDWLKLSSFLVAKRDPITRGRQGLLQDPLPDTRTESVLLLPRQSDRGLR